MQFKKIVFFIISTTILFTGCDFKKEEKERTTKELRKKEKTNFKLTSQTLKEYNLEKTENGMIFKELKDKIVLLNFFAPWCPACKAEIPHLNDLQNDYKNDFEIISINLGEKNSQMTSKEKIEEFINKYQIDYFVSNDIINFDLADAMGGIKSVPTMFLFEPSGNLIQTYIGLVPKQILETDIKKILEGK